MGEFVALGFVLLLAMTLLVWHLGGLAWQRLRGHWALGKKLRNYEKMSPREVSEACQRARMNFAPGVLRKFAYQDSYLIGRMFGKILYALENPCLSGWSWSVKTCAEAQVFLIKEILDLPFFTSLFFDEKRFEEGLRCGIYPCLFLKHLDFAREERSAERRKARREAKSAQR